MSDYKTHKISVTINYYELVDQKNDEWVIKQKTISKIWGGEWDGGEISRNAIELTILSSITVIPPNIYYPSEYNELVVPGSATAENIEEPEFKNEDGSTPDIDPSTGGDSLNETIKQTTPNPSVGSVTTPGQSSGAATSPNNEITNKVSEISDTIKSYISWDPRLRRYDEYFEDNNAMKIPFASYTIATAFADISNTMEKGVVQALLQGGEMKKDSPIGKILYNDFYSKHSGGNNETSDNRQTGTGHKNSGMDNLSVSEKIITHDTTQAENDSKFYGVQSIVNPYSLTKLVGGINKTGETYTNYMYDIRDLRRFYDIGNNDIDDIFTVSNPTVTQLINWANHDKWGRTPYSFQDFVYCKYFGLIPNNRLITLRRYPVPTYDNLLFEIMNGSQEAKTQNSAGQSQTEKEHVGLNENENPNNAIMAPVSTVVSWFGGETGNSLNGLMSFTTGIKWGNLKSDMWNISGDTGESKQSVIDKMLGNGDHTTLTPSAEMTSLNGMLKGASVVSAKVISFGKLALALNGDIGMSLDAYDKLMGANVDPYESTFKNRILGPVNRIEEIKKREPGIEFSQSLTVKCAYKTKAIGGINPKAAILDVLGNCLGMVSPHALFWGGGHRFQIKPQIYPFHDGGWRDSFMKRIYEGKILGPDGAISAVLSGLNKSGNNEKGEFSYDALKGILGNALGSGANLLGSAIGSLSKIFGADGFFDSVADTITGMGMSLSGEDENMTEEEKKKALEKKRAEGNNQIKNILGNMKTLWLNRVISQTAMPSITSSGNILIGEPVGEWHLTIGNPLNPIMVIGNLICSKMKVDWDEELGPDDFPTGFSVEYSLEHAMARDNDAIQSMFNRGMGKYYTLPDYISTSSDRITYVDKFTKNVGTGDFGNISYKNASIILKEAGWSGNKVMEVDKGSKPKHAGSYNTSLITKFNPINSLPQQTIAVRRTGDLNTGVVSRVKSLASTRKYVNN